MKKIIISFVISLLVINLLVGNLALANHGVGTKLKIGLIYDGSDKFNKKLKTEVKEEILQVLAENYQVDFMEVRAENLEAKKKAIDQLLANRKIDVVIPAGILSSHLILQREELNKPVIAPFILDDETVDISSSKNRSGIKNLNFITAKSLLEQDIKAFQRLADFKKITYVIPKNLTTEINNLVNLLKEDAQQNNVIADYIYVTDSKKDLSKQLDKIEAAYISPLIVDKQLKTILRQLKKEQVPTFTVAEVFDLKQGILAGYSHRKEIQARARAAALNLELILSGEQPSELPIYIEKSKEKLLININLAQKINILPNWEVLNEAKLVNQQQKVDQKLNLAGSIKSALQNNPDFAAAKQEVKLAASQVTEANNNYLPQLDLNTTLTQIDEDRARLGFVKEKTLTAGLQLKQVLFNEQLNANSDIKESLYQKSKAKLVEKKLNLTLDTINSYLNTLKAKADVKLQEENIKLTTQNLNIAKMKHEIGASGPTDIYRWQSERAVKLSKLETTKNKLRQVKDNLKRILNIPLAKEISLEEIKISPIINSLNNSFDVDNPWELERAAVKLVEKGLAHSPELDRINHLIAAKRREYKMRKRNIYLPEVGLAASYNTYLEEEGIGTGGDSLLHSLAINTTDPALKQIISQMPKESPDEWQVSVRATFDLYSGGNKQEKLKQVKEEIKQLQKKKEAIKDKLKQNIRSKVTTVNAEYMKNKYSKQAVVAANQNLELVQDAYSKGQVSATELLDAQAAVINAKRQQFVTKYNFLIAVAEVERALGQFKIMKGEE